MRFEIKIISRAVTEQVMQQHTKFCVCMCYFLSTINTTKNDSLFAVLQRCLHLLIFFFHLHSSAPLSLDFHLDVLDFLGFSFQFLCGIPMCAHSPAVFYPLMGTGRAFTYADIEFS